MLPGCGPAPDADGRPNLSAMLAARGPPPLPKPDMGTVLGTNEPQPQDGAEAPPCNPFGKGGLPPRGLPFGGGGRGGGLGGLGGGLGGGGAGGLGGLPKPKKAAPQPLGVNVLSDAEGRALTPTARLRGLDALRMHEPIASEREKLKLPGGDRDRLSVGPDLKTLLLFCGAARGVRFATSELLELKTLAASAEAAYAHMDASYKQLSAAARKRKVPPPPSALEEKKSKEVEKEASVNGLDMESYTAPSAAQVLASIDGGSDGGAALADDGDAAKSVGERDKKADDISGGAKEVEDDEDPVVAEVLAFHATADAYCAAFRALASDFVGRKQKEVPEGGGEIVVDKDHGEGLRDAKPFPQYLQALLDKYKAAAGPGGGASKSGGVIDSLGAFATFLGCCLFLHQPITPVELDALEVLVLASDDGSGANLESLPCFRASSNEEPSAQNGDVEGERKGTGAAAATDAAADSFSSTSEEACLPPPPSESSAAPMPVLPTPMNPSTPASPETLSDGATETAPQATTAASAAADAKEEEEAAAPGARKAIERPLKFWVQRVWVFLTKVRELKSVPKDEKVLCDAALIARWSA